MAPPVINLFSPDPSIPTLPEEDQVLEVLSFVGYAIHDCYSKSHGTKKKALDALFTIKAEKGNGVTVPVVFDLVNRGRLTIVKEVLVPWGMALITLIRNLVTSEALIEKKDMMLDSAWKGIEKSLSDGELATLSKASWMEIFENDTPTRDNTSLMNAIIAELASKTFHSRAKECLVGFKTRTCGRGAQKDSMALRTRLKCGMTGDDSLDAEDEKMSRQAILASSQQKAIEDADTGNKKRPKESSGPYKTNADNEKDENCKSIAKKMKFTYTTRE